MSEEIKVFDKEDEEIKVVEPSVDESPVEEPLFRAERDTTFDRVPGKILYKYGYQLDSDVYRYETAVDEKGEKIQLAKQVLSHKYKYITQESFSEKVDGTDTYAVNCKKLTDYLLWWGKIPKFLEVRQTENKGLGVFTTTNLNANVFLGYYGGFYRPLPIPQTKNRYLYNFTNFDAEVVGAIDADNITFSNFTRFINDGKEPNVEYVLYNFQVMCYTRREIQQGEELTASYGEEYWKNFGPKYD